MTIQYQFARSVSVNGKLYAAGDLVDSHEIEPSYLDSCLRLRHLVQVEQVDPAEVFASTMLSREESVEPTAELATGLVGPPAAEPTLPVIVEKKQAIPHQPGKRGRPAKK